MNSTNKPNSNDVFLNVRKAYRLLHDYQRMVLDAVRYIETQLDIPYRNGFTTFAEYLSSGNTKLDQDSWDWLPMIGYEFNFFKELEEKAYLSLSLFIISDTGWYHYQGGEQDNKGDNLSDFAPPDQSFSKFAFIIGENHPEAHYRFEFMVNKIQMREFLNENRLTDDLIQKGFVGKCYPMSCLTSEKEVNKVISEVVAMAKERSWPLDFKKASNTAAPIG